MIHIPPLQSSRIRATMRELTLAQAVRLAAMPPTQMEASTTAFLRHVVTESQGAVTDVADWTVQERMWAVAHYYACTDSGDRNFMIAGGRLLDFLTPDDPNPPTEVHLGEACGDTWRMSHLTGAQAEALEATAKTQLDWISGAMAAQLTRPGKDEPSPNPKTEGLRYAEWLLKRAEQLQQLGESEFCELYAAFNIGAEQLKHLFVIDFDDQGPVAMPQSEHAKGTGVTGAAMPLIAPARFPVSTCLSELARHLGRRSV